MGQIPVDRGAGVAAMNSLVKGCQQTISSGRSVMIFPQGTRTAVGAQKPYKAGIAKIYRDVQVPIVPMALNSGVFWGAMPSSKNQAPSLSNSCPPFLPDFHR